MGMRRGTTRTLAAVTTGLATGATVLGVGWLTPTSAIGQEAPLPTGAQVTTDTAACQTLLQSYIDRGLTRVGPYGWGGDRVYATLPTPTTSAGVDTATEEVTSTETGTNVQESGADEPDVVKVAGKRLVTLRDNELTIHSVSGMQPKELSSTTVSGVVGGQLLVSGNRVVVMGNARNWHFTRVLTYDISNPKQPTLVTTQTYKAQFGEARMIDGVLRVVLDNGLPDLKFTQPSSPTDTEEALAKNREIVRRSTLADWLPTLDGQQFVDCASIHIPEADAALATTTVIASSPLQPTVLKTGGVATSSVASYFSTDRFYMSGGWDYGGGCGWICPMVRAFVEPGTDLYGFSLSGLDTTFVASGQVKGSVRDRWAMDYADGTLRLALSNYGKKTIHNSIATLREQSGSLVETGRIDHLGQDEDIKAVRWFDDLALLVTFRRIDPLYAVDLSDPTRPTKLGELKIPGYSEYLHPIGKRRLIGIGQDVRNDRNAAAQAALFDVSNLRDVRRIDKVTYPDGSYAAAGYDPRQFTWLPDRRIALTVVTQGYPGRAGWISVLKLDKGHLTNRLVRVAYSTNVDQVRTVPLPGGKVALVTPRKVEFFPFTQDERRQRAARSDGARLSSP